MIQSIINFASFCDFSIGFRNCSDGAVFCVFHFIRTIQKKYHLQRKNEKQYYSTVGTVPKSNRNLIERGKFHPPGTPYTLSLTFRSNLIKSGGVKLVLWTQTFHLIEMMLSCRNVFHM
jgi:3-deoxy-D-arabino-heptulosonate 7-phosphate (DAHP) synthase